MSDNTAENIAARLVELGLELPAASAPAAKYVPVVIAGNMLYTSGQLPLKGGKLTSIGLVGRDISIEEGQEAAKWSAMNVLAQANAAAGGLENIKKLVKSPYLWPQPLISHSNTLSPMAAQNCSLRC